MAQITKTSRQAPVCQGPVLKCGPQKNIEPALHATSITLNAEALQTRQVIGTIKKPYGISQ
jgi:hypothetical protein